MASLLNYIIFLQTISRVVGVRLENSACKISRKSDDSCRINQKKTCDVEVKNYVTLPQSLVRQKKIKLEDVFISSFEAGN